MDLPNTAYDAVPQIETPAHIRNGVHVRPAKNYDLSRGLNDTPIKPIVGEYPEQRFNAQQLPALANANLAPKVQAASPADKPPVVYTKTINIRTANLDPNQYSLQSLFNDIELHPGYVLEYSTSAEEKSPANLAVFEFVQKIVQILAVKDKVVYEIKNTGFGSQFRIEPDAPVTITMTFKGYAYEPFFAK